MSRQHLSQPRQPSREGRRESAAARPAVTSPDLSPEHDGRPLDEPIRQPMDPFGFDFSKVRIYAAPRTDGLLQRAPDPQAEPEPPIESFVAIGTVIPGLAWVYAAPSALADMQDRLLTGDTVRVTGRTGYFWVIEHAGKRGFVLQHDLDVGADPRGNQEVEEMRSATGAPIVNWLQIIPDAVPRKGAQALVESPGRNRAQGGLVTYESGQTSYNVTGKKQDKTTIATAGPLSFGVTQEKVQDEVKKIQAARDRIRERFFRKSNVNVGHFGGAAVDNPKDPKAQSDPKQHETDPEKAAASTRYTGWLEKAPKPQGATDRQWGVFQRILKWEGDPSAVMTYDAANVTWGAGFAGLGARPVTFPAGPEMLSILFKSSPEARAIFWDAGFSFLYGELVVVDPDKGWKLRGLDAEIYVRGNMKLLSLMINVAQGEFLQGSQAQADTTQRDEGLRRAVLYAQFQVFLNRTYSEADSGATLDVVALKAHVRHSGTTTFGSIAGFNDLAGLVTHLCTTNRTMAQAVVPADIREQFPICQK